MTKKPTHIEINNPRKVLTYTYVISLSVIAMLSIVVHFMLDHVIAEQSTTGKVVNVSGEQRMLSQRVSLFAVEYLTLGTPEAKFLALASLNKMQINHQNLLSDYYKALKDKEALTLSVTLQNMYFKEPQNVDGKLKLFTKQVEAALTLKPGDQQGYENIKTGFLAMAKEPLLNALNMVVMQYEKESIDKVNELRFAQNVVLGIIILTILIEAFLVFRPMVDRISKFAYKLQYDASFDHLTGLLNRRSFNVHATKAIIASRSHKQKLGVVIFDIDLFKRINDTYGHAAGDLVIQHVSNILKESCRTADCVARFGGEEFVMLLPDMNEDDCFHLADKIREKIKTSRFQFENTTIELAISAGVAMLDEGQVDIEEPLRLADEALYDSKNNGRNLVTLYKKSK